MGATMSFELNATISDRINYGPEVANFRIVPDGWELPDFKPGQFATLGLFGGAPRCAGSEPDKKAWPADKIIRRAYSIASSPLIRDYLEFNIVLVKEGVLTPRIWNLKVGDKIFLGGKITGQFTMDEVPPDAHVVFIATGTGIAPYMSMLGTFLKGGQKRRFALFHGVRTSQDLCYRSECLTLQQVCDNFSYHPIISRPQLDPIPWKGPVGHVQKLWETNALSKTWGFGPEPKNTHFFLCGSPGMIDDMIKMLGSIGFREHTKKEPGQIHVEKYW